MPGIRTMFLCVYFLLSCTIGEISAQQVWTQRNPLPTGESIRQVAYGNGKYIGIADGGLILASTDGVNWSKHKLNQSFWSVVWGSNQSTGQAGLFVVSGISNTGVGSDSGIILTSSDGITWSQKPFTERVNSIKVIWGNNQFVALAKTGLQNDTTAFFTSADGLNWSKKASMTIGVYSIYTVGNLYLGLGGNGIYSSSDCISWTLHSINLNIEYRFKSVTWDGHRYYIVADSSTSVPGPCRTKIITSIDGISWVSTTEIPAFSGSYIVWNGNTYVIAGADTFNKGAIYTSTDGSKWVRQSFETTETLVFSLWAGNQFICTGEKGYLLTSVDGTTWIDRSHGARTGLSGISYGNNQFVAASTNLETTIYFSLDGLSWNGTAFKSEYIFKKILCEGSQPNVGIAEFFDTTTLTSSTLILTSSDAKNWVSRLVLNSKISLNGIAWGGNQYVIVGDSIDRYNKRNGRVYTSPDGINWTGRSTSTPDPLRAISWVGNQYIAVGDFGTILSSNDGFTWTDRSPGVSDFFKAVIGKSNKIVVISSNSIYSSLDGFTWAKQTKGSIAGSLNEITYAGGIFVIVGGYGTILSSSDGNSWQIENASTTQGLSSIAFGKNQFVAVGENGSIFSSPVATPVVRHTVVDCRDYVKINNFLPISYKLSTTNHTTLKIYDIHGRLSRTIVNGIQSAGEYSISIPRDLAQGSYIVSYRAGDIKIDKLMIVAR